MKLICLFTLVSIWWALPLAAETLKIGINPWTPWIMKENGQYTGIVVEICKQAIRRAGHRSVIVEIPQKRRDMLEWGRSVDVEPGCEKMWRIRQENVSVYTDPYIRTRNVIVTRKGSYPLIRSITTFYGTTIGANAGYYYTDGLSHAFENGLITRDDCGPGHQLVSKLIKRRFNAIVADTYEWKYWMKALGQDPSGYEESYSFSHSNNLRIRLHKSKVHLVEALNYSLREMKDDHTIDAIVRHFLSE